MGGDPPPPFYLAVHIADVRRDHDPDTTRVVYYFSVNMPSCIYKDAFDRAE